MSGKNEAIFIELKAKRISPKTKRLWCDEAAISLDGVKSTRWLTVSKPIALRICNERRNMTSAKRKGSETLHEFFVEDPEIFRGDGVFENIPAQSVAAPQGG